MDDPIKPEELQNYFYDAIWHWLNLTLPTLPYELLVPITTPKATLVETGYRFNYMTRPDYHKLLFDNLHILESSDATRGLF